MSIGQLRVVMVSSYPPRQCGLATFASDLGRALLHQGGLSVQVAAIDSPDETYSYEPRVIARIQQDDPEGYVEAVDRARRAHADLLCVQHEYGIWGEWGDNGPEVDHTGAFLEAAQRERIPVVTTLHTIRPSPTEYERETMREIVDRSAATVVMVRMGAMILMDDYDIAPEKLVRIPHGVPVIERRARRYFKNRLGLEGRTLITTMGLLDPRKGIEYAIQALPSVIEQHPEVLYLVVGQTHPELRKRAGEQYRNELAALARELGVARNVRFVNQYLSDRELVDYLQATDVYLTPYLDRHQITSGTLAFAVGTGRAIISTPYPHATEALAEGRGLLSEFRSADSLSNCLLLMLDNPEDRHAWEIATAEYGKRDSWPDVGAQYADLFRRVVCGSSLEDLLAVEPDPFAGENGAG
jgi:glycosyltransferase involved in cell wall biosynthesis